LHDIEQLGQLHFDRWWKLAFDQSEEPAALEAGQARIVAQLGSGDPFLLGKPVGRGRVLMSAVPLDADWGAFPTLPSYVPFLHEAVFHLASAANVLNVEPGKPPQYDMPAGRAVDQYAFFGPGDTAFPARIVDHPHGMEQHQVRLDDTRLPGLYELRQRGAAASTVLAPAAYAVVEHDRGESDVAPLGPAARASLEQEHRIRFVRSLDDIAVVSKTDAPRTDVSTVFLLAFLGVLVVEVALKRRLVKGGHATSDNMGS
jgi:hypothetical protein